MVTISKKSFVRSRWVMAGAVVAVALGAGGVLTSSAAPSANASSFVPITPCRIMDTRAGAPVGPRATPIGAEEYVLTVWGTNGQCVIPSTATAVSLNVTFANPTAGSFVSVFPADKPWPNTSNLNFAAGQAPGPNAVTSALSVADGKLKIRNDAGTVNLLVDVVGYYEPAGSGSTPVDPCAAFVGTYVSDDANDLMGTETGLIIQLSAGGGMSAVPQPGADPITEQTTDQEGRWSCSGAGFSARTLDIFVGPEPFIGRWDWSGSLTGDTLTFTRTLCDFALPLIEDVQTADCGSGADVYPTATATRITIPEISPASVSNPGTVGTESMGRGRP